MTQLLLQSVIFLSATLITTGLMILNNYYNIYQPLIPVILAINIIAVSRINSGKNYIKNFPKLTLLLTSSILVQLIIVSSGGFYSPLLILLHLFTIGAIYIINSSSPVFFLLFSFLMLIFQIWYDPNLSQFFSSDPWTTVIYGLSIIIVIPLALFLSRNNSSKNTLTEFLKDYIYTSESRQKSILTALNNMVIVTDKNLSILTVNNSLERLLRLPISQMLNKPLFEIIKLKSDTGETIIPQMLPIEETLRDKATHFVDGYSLEVKTQAIPKPVSIQIKPVIDSRGEVIQIIFVFNDPSSKIGFNTHPSIKQAVKKRDYLLSLITSAKLTLPPQSTQLLVLAITHIEEDILTVQEMEDHPMQEVIIFEDLVVLITKILEAKKYFYGLLGVNPILDYEDENRSETAFLNMSNSDSKQGTSPLSKYSAPIDGYLLKIIIEKLIDLGVFVTASFPDKTMNVKLRLADSDKTIILDFIFPSGVMKATDINSLFSTDYPGLKLPTLKDSSGLEGYIASKISKALLVVLVPTLNPYTKTITVSLAISKQAKINKSII